MHAIRSVRFALLALVAAATAASPAIAQDTTNEGAKAYIIDAFERARDWDVSLAQAIPDSAMDWAPNPDVRGFAEQVIHAANNGFIALAVFGTEAPEFGDSDALTADKMALVAAVTDSYDWIIAQVEAMPEAGLSEETQFFGRTVSRARVLMFALEHAMWTRGQLVPYLHAHGVAVPQQRLF
jgi:hypothetical protein